MQLRSVARRSLSGSITIVGDIGQATGPWAPDQLGRGDRPPARPAPRPHGRADRQLPHAGRGGGGGGPGAGRDRPRAAPAHAGAAHRGGAALRAGRPGAPGRAGGGAVDPGVSATSPRAPPRCWRPARWWPTWPSRSTPRASRPPTRGATASGRPLSLLPVDLANGLEFDAVVVVEPAAIVEESPQGLRALYVALTRPTRRLAVIHTRPLPAALQGLTAPAAPAPRRCR